jgi:hypothetical protein
MGMGVVVAVMVVGLGAAGWTVRHDARDRHHEAIIALDQAQFCRDLRQVILPLTGGLGTEVPFDIPPELKNQDLTEQGRSLVYDFTNVVIPEAPPALREPLETVSDAADESAKDLSIAPFTTARVERSIKDIVDWYDENC